MPRTKLNSAPNGCQEESAINNETNRTPEPDTFPPKGLYTGVAIAEYFGVHEDSIRKTYYPEALEIYATCPEILRKGNLYTQVFWDEFFRMRQCRFKDKMTIGSKGQVVRHAPESVGHLGLPVTEPNSDRITKKAYRELRWSEQPELKPVPREDSIEAEIVESDGTIVLNPSQVTVYEARSEDRYNRLLDQIQDMTESRLEEKQGLKNLGARDAAEDVMEYAEGYLKEFGEKTAEVRAALGKLLGVRLA